ncbi:MAG: transposase [Gemmatimonadaceae bacterium]|nr:transposase [Gemmatimonadaceae bacterium]
MLMSCDDAGTKVIQRFEVFTGGGRRRVWSADDKAVIVAESLSGRETVCAVARRHGLSPSQLFAWRRLLRSDVADPSFPSFVPAVITAPVPAPVVTSMPKRRRSRRSTSGATAVELKIDGVAVKIAQGADAKVIAAVIGALKSAR